MSQRTELRALDAEIFAALSGSAAGGDAAVFYRKSGAAVACNVFVDLNVQRFGDQGQVVYFAAAVTAFLSDVTTAPVHGEYFVVDGDTWTVDGIVTQDQSRAVAECKAGR